MRQIKFKAYQKNAKWTLPVLSINWGADGEIESIIVDNTNNGTRNVPPRSQTFYKDDPIYSLDILILTEFTGLTDKNGKEAYSGHVYRDSHGTIRTIWADQGGFRSESNPLSFGYGSQGNSNPSIALADQQTASWFEGNCEIIGSIHDTPELLTK